MRYLITGGAGFIGSNYVHHLINSFSNAEVLVYDKLTYAGRLENFGDLTNNKRFRFVRGDICDEELLSKVVKEFEPEVIISMAAESHVDRSINDPAPFLKTNVEGTFKVLEVCRRFDIPMIVHFSTDEIYGDREGLGPADELTAFSPRSPYSASKAAGDHLVMAYHRTYGLRAVILRPSNNYGPRQHPEKLIPKAILRALNNYPIPVYGDGSQVRDWLFVEDTAEAVDTVINKGEAGQAYNVPGGNPKRNVEVVKDILKLMGKPESLIKHVEDRPGHDRVYSMRGDKIRSLGWRPKTPWIKGLRKTIEWYLSNEWWWRPLVNDKYFTAETPWRIKE